jgi:uncharacterized membrane protein
MSVVRDPSSAPATRVVALDVVRGAVMVLMAIDHVRVYSGLPAGGPTAGIFFTRWVTHFCAPAFVFLAGTSAFLWGRSRPTGELSQFLATRGAWLVLLELTVIRVAWTFNFDFAHYLLLGVIWMIGWCMILTAALVWLPTSAIGTFGIAVIAAQNVVGVVARAVPQLGSLWQVVYVGGVFPLGADGPRVAVLYSIVPWIGVMAAGYAFGAIIVREPAERRALFLRIGLAATALFLVAGTATLALNPPPANARPVPVLFRLLNQQKYPASQLFLLMTLGPTIALLPILDRPTGGARPSRALNVLSTFGRVPFFYYILHIPTIHAAAVLVSLFREGRVNSWLFGNHPMMPPPVPPGYAWSLPLLYAVFAVVVAALYWPCAWFARLKAGHRTGLLRYL